MAGWRTTGHLPVVGSVPFRWTPWSKKQVKQGESAHGYDDTALRMMAEMKEPPSVKTLRDAVMRAGVLGPAKPVRPEREGVAGEVAQCWQLRRRLSILQTMLGGGLVVVFRYFKVRIAYLKAHRKLKKALRDGKRRQALALLQQAEEAAVRNDVRQMYGVVRLLCPNRHIQEIRLRDSKGQLMNGEAECRVWADYARKLFSAPKIEPFVLQRIPEEYISIDRWRNWKAHAPLLDIQDRMEYLGATLSYGSLEVLDRAGIHVAQQLEHLMCNKVIRAELERVSDYSRKVFISFEVQLTGGNSGTKAMPNRPENTCEQSGSDMIFLDLPHADTDMQEYCTMGPLRTPDIIVGGTYNAQLYQVMYAAPQPPPGCQRPPLRDAKTTDND
ncbi:unnamed protein product [Symbiodinium microadriaticum]|nr:unnamed protein product [Symbiodinium microadriaticum]CAE7802987.1 unnamed protein product [Symbiodinium sp. KB8]